MNITSIIASLDEEIARLQKAHALLSSIGTAAKQAATPTKKRAKAAKKSVKKSAPKKTTPVSTESRFVLKGSRA